MRTNRRAILFATCAAALSAAPLGTAAGEQEPNYWSDVKQQDAIGPITHGDYALRGRVISFEPGAVAKFHQHKAPGIRYILEGTVMVKFKDGTAQTFEEGDTFFEGPIGDQPARFHEVSNEGDVVAKIWNVELIIKEKSEK